MALTPRSTGRVAARAHFSPSAATFLKRVAPFFAADQVAGGPLLIATIIALVCTNLPIRETYEAFWDSNVELAFASSSIAHPLADWINDALLPLFFLIIGTEVKQEFTHGSLSTLKTATFPLVGAIGGILVPAAVYLGFNLGSADAHGWGTVITSDTAFAIAIIGMFGNRLPVGLRAVLLAFAAIDDVGGLLVIAGAYTESLAPLYLVVAALAYAAIYGLVTIRWVSPIPYVLLGLIVWAGVYASGVHATIAGVMLGFLLPTRSRISAHVFAERVQRPLRHFQETVRSAKDAEGKVATDAAQKSQRLLGYMQEMTQATDEPAAFLVRTLTPWVTYIVLPLFALSAVRIHFSPNLLLQAATSMLGIGVLGGLMLGKPIGFVAATWVAVKLRLAELPDAVTWRMVVGIGALAGIGFTISLFIANLAFPDEARTEIASLAVLAASIVSALFGYVLLRSAAAPEDG